MNVLKYQLLDRHGNEVGVFDSITEAKRVLNITTKIYGNITACLRGERPTASGYIWKYKEEPFIDLPGEEWKDIPEFQGLYQASNKGRVRSTQFHGKPKARLLSVFTNDKGYKMVKIRDWYRNFARTYPIHRLVASVFLPNPEAKEEVDHIDTNPSNNNLENLRWVTRLENQRNPLTAQRLQERLKIINQIKLGPKVSAERRKRPVLYNDGVRQYHFNSLTEASCCLNIPLSTVYQCCAKHKRGFEYALKEDATNKNN